MTDYTKLLRTTGFGLTALLVLILICATVAEKLYGTAFVSTFVYGSPLFVTLWGTAAVFSLLYLIRRKLPPSCRVEEGSKLSVRGKGKFIIDRLGPLTKKGRLCVSGRKYI